jgi:N,N'-diacetyllegionaminate synthase
MLNESRKVFIIAEVGVNHNGSVELAKQLICAAKSSGADAVKFQTYSTESLVAVGTPKVPYQARNSDNEESHFSMLKRLELSRDAHFELNELCSKLEIMFLSTPYDINSAAFLHERLAIAMFKTASADIVDLPLHRYIASTKKPAIVSVGMSSLGEVEEVVDIYRRYESERLVLLHCVANYPCSDESLNLRNIVTLKHAFACDIGFSDHSLDDLASVLAVSMGASVIERHFTLDKGMRGPDHAASLNPQEFSNMVTRIRRAEKMLGSFVKARQPEEEMMCQVSRKSLHLARDAMKGEKINEEMFVLRRPGTGLYFSSLSLLKGRLLKFDLPAGHRLSLDDLL